ncbi:MAG: GTPase ObgE [Bacteroidetes bacterium]|nr:GTPase ObgE [Bacteroidota bacterium]
MAESNFVDYVKIYFRSGKGGAGSVHFHRDKITAKGGPDGGDGGAGGSVILKGNSQLWTLLHLKYQKHILCEDGKDGQSQNKTGGNGKNEIVEVPLGTVARNAETGEVIFEITEHNQTQILMQGGRGGLGNWHFKTPVKQAPRYAQPGENGTEGWVIIELKVLADVGLVGFPNAGKSTLLSVITSAKPEIANYPFTTLVPNLGIVKYRNFKSFIVADIPGIIEGAAEGKGLGSRFLRHIERNSVLLFMISAETGNIIKEYNILLNELKKHNPELMFKKRLIAITKSDLLDEELRNMLSAEIPENIDFIFISSVTGFNIQKLKDKLWQMLQ